MSDMRPFYENVQSHYDLSDDFFALFLDPSRTYSCAYFEQENYTLEQAQLAKIDLSLSKCDLSPGQKLLDIGCGWGGLAARAAGRYGVHVTGLTLSRNQHAFASQREVEKVPGGVEGGSLEFRLQGWEEFDEPVDRIVSVGAFEHFRFERHAEFFKHCSKLLPPDGRMMLHTIVVEQLQTMEQRGVPVTAENVAFAKFIRREIFPGGQLISPELIQHQAEDADFTVERVHRLGPHYARTLDLWGENLAAAREKAIEITSEEVYNRYIKYLAGCADHFRSGHIDVIQFTLLK